MVIVTVGGRYVIDEPLGEGGMGCVYRARHLHLNKQFALKLISPANALDEAHRARFNEEAKLASEIAHPNIVSIVDFGEDPEHGAYMVMELVDGVPLLRLLPMTMRRALEVLCQISDAIAHIHRSGIIHGDVKADNIMLVETLDGPRRKVTARLLDFGLARRTPLDIADSSESEGPVIGSPHYMAPERIQSGERTIAADIYALGVLAYLLVAGTLPFEGTVVEILAAHANDRPQSPTWKRDANNTIRSLDNLISRAMSKDPALRHPNAEAFRYELNTVMDMLAMSNSHRRTSQTMKPLELREVMQTAMFQRSPIAQALLGTANSIILANEALQILVNRDTLEGVALAEITLAEFIPDLAAVAQATADDQKPRELHARVERSEQPALELDIWLVPVQIGTGIVHMLVKVTEVAPTMPS